MGSIDLDVKGPAAILAAGFGLLAALGCCTPDQSTPPPDGLILGQTPPGLVAEIFAPDLLSTDLHEDGAPWFSPDGNEVYWRIANEPQVTLLRSRLRNGSWSLPEKVPHVEDQETGRMCLTPNGGRLYYSSRQRIGVGEKQEADFDLWFMERDGDDWGKPRPLGEAVNSPHTESDPSVAANGTLYFHREGAPGEEYHILRSRMQGGRYLEPVRIRFPDGDDYHETAPFVAPDESFMIFSSFGRPGQLGLGDLYVSFNAGGGRWSVPRELGPGVNSRYDEKFASLSPDGKYLFFISTRPRTAQGLSVLRGPNYRHLLKILGFSEPPEPKPHFGDIYWVDARVIRARQPD